MRKETVNAAFFFLVLAVLVVAAFLVLLPILDFVLFGFLLAIGFYPVHRVMRRLVRHDIAASFLTLFVAAMLVLLPLVLVTLSLFSDAREFVGDLRFGDLEGSLGPALGIEPGSRADHIVGFLIPYAVDLIEGLVLDLGEILARLAVGLLVLSFVLYYAFKEGPSMVATVKDLLPLKAVYKERLVAETESAVHAMFYGTLLVGVVHGVALGIGFAIFQLPNPVLWGFIAILISILPALGTPLVWLPASAYVYVNEGPALGIGLGLYSLIVSTILIEHWWKLRLIGSMGKMHPLLVLVGVVGGVALFGLSGFIFGPLVLALLLVFARTFSKTYKEDENYLFL